MESSAKIAVGDRGHIQDGVCSWSSDHQPDRAVAESENIPDSDRTSHHQSLEEEEDSTESCDSIPILLKDYIDTMVHVFEGYAEVFKQSDEHENFTVDKMSKVKETAGEHLDELMKSKQEHFEKLNLLSATLSHQMNSDCS